MKALTWQGKQNVSVETVPDPQIQEADDIIIEVTTSGLCGSDLHLYDPLGPFLHPGDVLGHEPMGRVVERGSAITDLQVGDRVVIPFQIACGSCFMCQRGLQTQCETTQVREYGMGAALYGYTDLYGAVPGGQAEFLRVPHGNYNPIKVEEGPSDDRFVYLSDVAPTAWQGIEYSGIKSGETLVIVGLGPIGEMAARMALLRDVRVIGVDLVPERLARSAALGVETINLEDGDPVAAILDKTAGRGADAVMEAVGMEAHGSGVAETAQKVVGLLPKALSRPIMTNASTDRLAALDLAFQAVRRGGTVSISGVYAGAADPLSMQMIFDKQLTLRMGQANVKRWADDLLPLAQDDADPLGLETFATHHVPLDQAPAAYEMFQKKQDGAIKVLFQP
ncbi:alcohol dehydrogenase catalytic domain-containing protein [Aeromicrobium sp. SMF47]|uniref:Alcohol dehydrogenase catalytic domain-containing protein n=1 Tax=Aeromicrobium yanjiei TaxID=2662028 RepID=A0A5Q2MB07_9ACTN|nr:MULTISPECIES: alcohol dehydrogenase catalytic domain-containing protein [Aeromicrobium]MRJ75261.1 alcohol dehydrogenase catalytic domain-containing protein [Aeromicrobium yanjiei]MRK02681.1 alcohol dehydrogenase catalytic domain-containing protein [Aeromicrobium sp. S22]QGG40277.1 alcohol dehydrogenase catalytic domain-containing protein [Aeromicrobium yanjiei]